jgi:hypothetical protein
VWREDRKRFQLEPVGEGELVVVTVMKCAALCYPVAAASMMFTAWACHHVPKADAIIHNVL